MKFKNINKAGSSHGTRGAPKDNFVMAKRPGLRSAMAPYHKRNHAKKPSAVNANVNQWQQPGKSGNIYDNLKMDDDGGSSQGDMEEGNYHSEPKPEKVPPIVLKSEITDVKKFYEGLKSQLPQESSVHLRTYSNTRQIFTYTSEHFKIIKDYLTSQNFQYYTYTPKKELTKKLVLKGIDKSISSAEILDDLKQQYDGIIDVKQMKMNMWEDENSQTPNTTRAGQYVPVAKTKIGAFIVYVNRDVDLNHLMQNVKIVQYHVIVWERFKKREQPATFCYKCSRWGHSQKNCAMEVRCPLCSSTEHSMDNCNAKQQKDTKPVCPNCKGEHIGSYRECKAFRQYINRRKERDVQHLRMTHQRAGAGGQQRQRMTSTQQQPNTTAYPTNEYVNQNISFSQALKGNSNDNQSPHNSMGGLGFLDSEIGSLFGMSMKDMMSKIKNFLPMYRQIQDKSEKQLALIGLICDLCI